MSIGFWKTARQAIASRAKTVIAIIVGVSLSAATCSMESGPLLLNFMRNFSFRRADKNELTRIVVSTYDHAGPNIIADLRGIKRILTQQEIEDIIKTEVEKAIVEKTIETNADVTFEIATGKLIVEKSFRLKFLRLRVGEINIYKVSAIAAASIAACSIAAGGKELDVGIMEQCAKVALAEVESIIGAERAGIK
jgi:hypothetical protein